MKKLRSECTIRQFTNRTFFHNLYLINFINKIPEIDNHQRKNI